MNTDLAPKEFVLSAELMARQFTRDEACAYTRRLATSHYENFHLVSFLLPRHLHQDFYNVYAFCRWADDLGDEIGSRAESLRLLGWWRGELRAMYGGQASHPVFVALAATAARHDLPMEPFDDLIRAFEQDQLVTRYEDWAGVYDYCRYSANPVGRLVLYLCGYRDAERQKLSDATCTALQLANFWQDVSIDLEKDRVYMPLNVLRKHGYRVEDLFARRENPAYQAAMKELVAETRQLFHAGLPLVGMVDRRLALDLDLFSRGGLRVLDKIEAMDCRTLLRRPAIGKVERAGLLLRSLARLAIPRAA